MVDRSVVSVVLPPDAEAHRRGDVVGQSAQRPLNFLDVIAELPEGEIGADRRIPTGDVEADSDNGHLLAIRGDAADRHHITNVTVGHERGVGSARADILELGERSGIVRTKDLHRESGDTRRETGDGKRSQHGQRHEKNKASRRRGVPRPFRFPFPIPDKAQATEDRRDFAHRASRIHRFAIGTIRHPHLTAGPPRSSALVGHWIPAASACSH